MAGINNFEFGTTIEYADRNYYVFTHGNSSNNTLFTTSETFGEYDEKTFVAEELGRGFHNGVIAYLFFLSIISMPFNLVVIYLYFKNKHLHSPMNLMFLNLALSDLTVSFFGNCFEFIMVTSDQKMTANTLACDIYGFFTFLGAVASMTSLTTIAVARYLTVIRPFNMGNISYRGVIVSIIIVWCFSLIWSGGPLIGWSKYVPESVGHYCSINWLEDNSNVRSFITCIFLFTFVFPIAIITFSYGQVLAKVKEVAKSQGQVGTAGKAEKTITKMTAIMISCFLLAWTPYAIVALGATYGDADVFTPEIAILPALFAKSSCCYNPVIYVFLNKPFREALILLIFRGKNPFQKSRDVEAGQDNNTVVATVGVSSEVEAPKATISKNKVAPAGD